MEKTPKTAASTATMEQIVSLAKKRGFIFSGSAIYGGLANTWDYGPLGTEIKRKIKAHWWRTFVQKRADIVGLDASILMNPKVWQASGHVANFNDAKIDCKKCKSRHRADHLLEDQLQEKVEGKTLSQLNELIKANKLTCPSCGGQDFTPAKQFNLLFRTHIGALEEEGQTVYLRGETAQAMFVNFKNILDTTRKKLPFGIAQIGKVFRNEITPGNFIFRTLEFEQMEIEYFIRAEQWEKTFAVWQDAMWSWITDLGVRKEQLRIREHAAEELSHYSQKTVDIEYNYPIGWKELYGLAYRTDFDLKNHQQHSGEDLSYFDQEKNEKFIPHVIEPTFGVDRTLLTLLVDAYQEEEVKGEKRIVLRLDPRISPYQVAILPLSKKPELQELSQKIFTDLLREFDAEYDETQSIGRRYRRQDEIGTPYCVTVDFESLQDQQVTVRNRDTMRQERLAITQLPSYLQQNFKR